MPVHGFRTRVFASLVPSGWMRAAALGLSVALVLTLTGVSESSERAQAAPITVSTHLPCPDQRPDRQSAQIAARACGGRVEVSGELSETMRVWAEPDGSMSAELSLGVARFRRDGQWVDVDLNLVKAADGSVVPKAHPAGVVLAGPAGVGTHVLASVGESDRRITLGWTGRLPEPVLDGPNATYPDVYPGVDLVLRVTRSGVEQLLVVKDRKALSSVKRVQMGLTFAGASVEADGDGGLVFKDRSGQVVGHTPAPVMWDDAADPLSGEPLSVKRVGLSLDAREATATRDLVLSADEAWLADPARKFPVTIDPYVISPNWVSFDTYVHSGVTYDLSAWDKIALGTTDSGAAKRIAYVNLSAAGLAGARINWAALKLWGQVASSCPAGSWEVWLTNRLANVNTRWSNKPELVERMGSSSGPTDGKCTGTWVNADLTALYQYMADRAQDQFTAGLAPLSDSNNAYYKEFRSTESGTLPHVSLNWNDPPTVSGLSTSPATSCVTGAGRPTIATRTPQLSAVASDSDGAPSNLQFEWWVTGGALIGSRTVNNVPSGSSASVVVPEGAFSPGGTYSWRVRAIDPSGQPVGAWSQFCEFNVYEFAPPAQGCAGTIDSDFNGDGVPDVVIADPEAEVNQLAKAGQVFVIDGASGAVAVLHQGLAEVPGDAEEGAQFGHALAVYDANQDGCADLAVGIPFKDYGVRDAGMVVVLLGSPQGLGKGPAGVSMRQGENGFADTDEAGDWFGFSLAAGKTAAGEPYLIIGVPGEDIGTLVDAGAVYYLRGNINVWMHQDLASVPGVSENDDRMGYSVAASPYHFAVAQPGEAIGVNEFAGSVHVFSHELQSGVPKLVVDLSQNSPGVSDVSEPGDLFGKSISMAPYRPVGAPPGQPDSFLVVGVPGEDLGTTADTGMVHRFHISSSGASELPAVSQNTAGISGGDEDGDYFGERVLVLNTNPAAEASPKTLLVAVGAPGEDLRGVADAGVVRVFPAAANPIPGDAFIERPMPLPGEPIPQEFVGTAIGATAWDLYVATPYGDPAVYAIPWANLAAGNGTPARIWEPGAGGLPSSVVAFGAAVG